MLEVSSCVILTKRGHIIQDCAVGQHRRQTHTIRMKRVMSNELDATCVSCQVSSNEAGTFGAEVKRYFVAANLGIVLNVTKDAARFCAHDAI